MQTHFERELEKLNNRIVKMSDLVYQQVSNSVKAILEGDDNLAKVIIENDNNVDIIDLKIDKLCQRIFALAQPVASDLRFIMSALRINNDLERIGDIAVSIAKKVDSVIENTDFIKQFNIDKLANESLLIIKMSVDAYVNKDKDLAYKVLENAKSINRKCNSINGEIVEEMTKKSEVIFVATNLILILRQFKRLADHSENISESVIFWLEGINLKHSRG